MPNIRIMNWNVEKLSGAKTAIPGMVNNIARVIVDSAADIVIILELTSATGPAALALVSAQANILAGGNNYLGAFLSHPTGGDVYGVLIRDMNTVRPIRVVPAVNQPTGTDANPLGNLDRTTFATWPAPRVGPGAVANAYPLAGWGLPPTLPLVDVYSSLPRRRAAQRGRFAGRNLANGGYAMGRGFRMPCLLMFEIRNTPATATYILPILACHLGAVRGGANRLARGQIRQYKDIHISQKFQNPPLLANPFGGYIQLNGAVRAIQELIITGDFNVDFLQQAPPLGGNALRNGNRSALNTLTPTSRNGGAAAPAALPGLPGGAPGFPFGVIMGPPGPNYLTIPNLALKSANTTQGSILITVDLAVVPPNVAALRGANFDNFFFGGTQLSATFLNLTPAAFPWVADACRVINLPAQIVQAGGGGAGALDVSAIQAHQANRFANALAIAAAPPPPPPPHFHYGYAAPNLAPAAAAAVLTTHDRLIGTRFISDHLPTVVQFNLP